MSKEKITYTDLDKQLISLLKPFYTEDKIEPSGGYSKWEDYFYSISWKAIPDETLSEDDPKKIMNQEDQKQYIKKVETIINNKKFNKFEKRKKLDKLRIDTSNLHNVVWDVDKWTKDRRPKKWKNEPLRMKYFYDCDFGKKVKIKPQDKSIPWKKRVIQLRDEERLEFKAIKSILYCEYGRDRAKTYNVEKAYTDYHNKQKMIKRIIFLKEQDKLTYNEITLIINKEFDKNYKEIGKDGQVSKLYKQYKDKFQYTPPKKITKELSLKEWKESKNNSETYLKQGIKYYTRYKEGFEKSLANTPDSEFSKQYFYYENIKHCQRAIKKLENKLNIN